MPGWTVWTGGLPGGETLDQVAARVDRVLDRVRPVLADGDAVLVAHGHLLRILAARWLGLPPTEGRLLALGTAAVCVLGTEHETPVLVRWNLPNPAAALAAAAPDDDPRGAPVIRPITPQDVPAVVAMVHALAEYERAADQCHLTEDQLHTVLFGDRSGALRPRRGRPGRTPGTPVGFALWFLNFSTWRGVHGIYLEDLYVRPEARGSRLGRRLLETLAAICVERGYGRLDWAVLDWNTPARDVYDALGGTALHDWLPYRLDGEALVKLAENGQSAADPAAVAGSRQATGSPSDPLSS